MKIIVPMAGMGKRMRPHTHTTAKPLLPIAGKPIVQRLVEDLAAVAGEPVEEVAFVTNPAFGKKVEDELVAIAKGIGAKGTIHYQETALGTAHAILCAQSALSGRVIVAFADTLFRAQLKLDKDCDGVIWVNKVEDPKPFGVVKLDDKGIITEFVEKPQTFVSDLAIIGIYYFADGEYLRKEMQYLIDNDIKDKGEYQLTNAMENMKQKGARFKAGSVDVWMDCGNKNAMVDTNTKVLGFLKDDKNLVSKSPEKHQQRGDPAVLHRRGRDLDEQHRWPERFHREGRKHFRTVWCEFDPSRRYACTGLRDGQQHDRRTRHR